MTVVARPNEPIGMSIVTAICLIMNLYSYLAVILFLLLAYVSFIGFRNLRLQIRYSFALHVSDIQKWKKNHKMVCAFVRHLDRSFGPILLLEITYIFISFLINFFFALQSFWIGMATKLKLTLLTYIVKDLMTLCVICIIADKIKREVSSKV